MATQKFKEILKSNNIHDPVSEVVTKESELKGESLGSVVSFVTVKFENSQLDALYLFVKRLPDDEAQAKMIIESKQFIKEAMFFSRYLPEVQNLCKKTGQENLMDIYPKCYYADEKLIVLENLVKGKGFILPDKENLQDFNAAQFALTTLAKHHALSYAYMKDIGGPKEFLKRFEHFNFLSFDAESMRQSMRPFVDDPVALSLKILSRSNQQGKNKAIEVLKALQTNTYDKFMEPLRRKFDDDKTIRVLNHGDYWYSNMMFLKEKLGEEKYNAHVIIDFQLLNFNTPAVDVAYYLFTSVEPAARQANQKPLLEIWLDAFVKNTKDLGYPVEMTYESLLRDFRETFVHGFLIGLGYCTGMLSAVLGDADPSAIEFDKWASNCSKLVEKWIDDNPERNEENANIIISVVEEYQNLIIV